MGEGFSDLIPHFRYNLNTAIYNYQVGTYNLATLHKGPTLTHYLMGLLYFSSTYSRNRHFFEKYVRIKIEDRKILIPMSEHLRK